MSNNFDPMSKLPEECCFKILSSIDFKNIKNYSQVNKEWNAVSYNTRLWAILFPYTSSFNSEKSLKPYLINNNIDSLDKIAKCIGEFFKKIPLHQPAEFICSFLYNPECSIIVKFSCGFPDTTQLPLREFYFCNKKFTEYAIPTSFEYSPPIFVSCEAIIPYTWELDLRVQQAVVVKFQEIVNHASTPSEVAQPAKNVIDSMNWLLTQWQTPLY